MRRLRLEATSLLFIVNGRAVVAVSLSIGSAEVHRAALAVGRQDDGAAGYNLLAFFRGELDRACGHSPQQSGPPGLRVPMPFVTSSPHYADVTLISFILPKASVPEIP